MGPYSGYRSGEEEEEEEKEREMGRVIHCIMHQSMYICTVYIHIIILYTCDPHMHATHGTCTTGCAHCLADWFVIPFQCLLSCEQGEAGIQLHWPSSQSQPGVIAVVALYDINKHPLYGAGLQVYMYCTYKTGHCSSGRRRRVWIWGWVERGPRRGQRSQRCACT